MVPNKETRYFQLEKGGASRMGLGVYCVVLSALDRKGGRERAGDRDFWL
jgi:hypothetical protein